MSAWISSGLDEQGNTRYPDTFCLKLQQKSSRPQITSIHSQIVLNTLLNIALYMLYVHVHATMYMYDCMEVISQKKYFTLHVACVLDCIWMTLFL